MGIRRWFSGTFRPDNVETDSVSTDDASVANPPIDPTDVGRKAELDNKSDDDHDHSNESINPSDIDDSYLFVSNDAELTAALGKDGVKINLSRGEFAENRTINDRITISGTENASTASGSFISASWTLDDFGVTLKDITTSTDDGNSSITVTSRNITLTNILSAGAGSTPITVSADQAGIFHGRRLDITFETDTSGGVAVGNRDSTITDNGNNEVFANS